MNQDSILYVEGEDKEMNRAIQKAQDTFKYFWREMTWEYRRIVPAFQLACVKVIFTQEIQGKIETEHMWINDIHFDGDNIYGTLINEPDVLTNVKNQDLVKVPLSQISDWLLANDHTLGGFTIQLMRSRMNKAELREHDEAWGLNFGDFDNVMVVMGQDENPENLIEHPMSINMREKFQKYLANNQTDISQIDEDGYTMLHNEVIGGNKTIVEVLLAAGADPSVRTASGKTALDFAKQSKWNHIISVLENIPAK